MGVGKGSLMSALTFPVEFGGLTPPWSVFVGFT